MRARDLVFHLHCFTCTWCNAPLAQGDTFGLRDNLVYCRPHYESMARDAAAYFSPPPFTDHPPGEESGTLPGHCLPSPYTSSSMPAGRKGRPRKKRNGEIAGEDAIRSGEHPVLFLLRSGMEDALPASIQIDGLYLAFELVFSNETCSFK